MTGFVVQVHIFFCKRGTQPTSNLAVLCHCGRICPPDCTFFRDIQQCPKMQSIWQLSLGSEAQPGCGFVVGYNVTGETSVAESSP